MKTLDDIKKEFEEKFANENKMDSSSQFKKELQGRLYQEFEAFIEQAYQSGRESMREDINNAIFNPRPDLMTGSEYDEWVEQNIKQI